MIRFILIICLFFILGFAPQQAMAVDEDQPSFFSLKEIKAADKKYLAPLEHVRSSDAISLAFRSYMPDRAKAILVFYHGAGAHSGLTYNHIGVGLRDEFRIAVWTPDMRGHGNSEGPRGDAPSTEQVWDDINVVIQHLRTKHPELPLFLGGHSAGAGLTLNYSSWPERLPVRGYVFLAPYFGYRSKTEYDQKKVNFTSVDVSAFIANSRSGGLLSGHSKAVKFHFPPEVLEKNPEIVTFNTVNMSNAVTPSSPHLQFSGIERFGLWIGAQDESFDPIKTINFAKENRHEKADARIELVDNVNHFSILLKGHELMGPWMLSQIKK